MYEVLSHRDASWIIGESKNNRPIRLAANGLAPYEDCYRDTYGGKIISMRPIDSDSPSLRNMEDKDHLVDILDITTEQAEDIRNHSLKVLNGQLMTVTFEDRFGRIALQLKDKHLDPAQWEIDEATRVKTQMADNITKISDYVIAIETWRIECELSIADAIKNPTKMPAPLPKKPVAPCLIEITESSFDVEVSVLVRALPPTVTNTGTGLYFTKATPTKNDDTQSGAPAGQVITLVTGGLGADAFIGGYVLNVTRSETRAIVSHTAGAVTLEGDLSIWVDTDDLDIFDAWSTIQAAADQLFTDQGATTFTVSQYIRIFAGTYDENVIINSTLDWTAASAGFMIEGDPADSRADILIASSGTGSSLLISPVSGAANWTIQHLSFTSATAGILIQQNGTSARAGTIRDCAFSTQKIAVLFRAGMSIEDCSFVATGDSGTNFFIQATNSNGLIRRCSFKGFNTTTYIGILFSDEGGLVEGCSFSTMLTGTAGVAGSISNNTFYNCTTAISMVRGQTRTIINNIFSSCGINIRITEGWPQKTATEVGPRMILQNNIFHSYTTFASDDAVTKTYAEIIAMNDVDAVDNQDAIDPLMTNPATDDFSLQTNSPAIHTGRGSGVIDDVNGNIFDPYHPDIGAVSTGIGPNVAVGG